MAIPQDVTALLQTLEQAGHRAYLVGGCVRDMCMGVAPQDYDVATSALPEQVLALFPAAIPTGLQHGTVTVVTEVRRCEVTTFRTDGDYADHRHPTAVTFTGKLEDDLSRRDLTVNAMAMDCKGNILDPFGGRQDLQKKLLRCVGDPEQRFAEDALRIMRTLRFAATLSFAIEEQTARAMEQRKDDLAAIAAERLREEMAKLLCGQNVCPVLLGWPQILGVFLPEVLPCVGLDQRNPHHCYDVWGHIAHSVAAVDPDPVLRWAMLLHDVGKPNTFTMDDRGVGHFHGHAKVSTAMADSILHRLRFDNDTRQRIVTLVEWHDRDVPRTEKGLRRALYHLGETGVRQLIAVKRADNAAQHPDYRGRVAEINKGAAILEQVLAAGDCFSLKQLAVNGHDMAALGFAGPAIGDALDALLSAVVDGDVPNDRAALLQRAGALKNQP